MKSEKGVTLISLIIYVIVMTIVIGIMAILSSFFYKNTKDIRDINPLTEYTKFNSFFSEEVNFSNIKIVECVNSEDKGYNYVVFDNGVQFTFIGENKGIYRNQAKICSNIIACEFERGTNSNGKETIKVTIKAENDTTNKAPITYTLK